MSKVEVQYVPDPSRFQLRFNQEWFKSDFVIPDCLSPHQNLFDQPAFALVLSDSSIFPKELFRAGVYDFGRVAMLNIFFRNWSEKKGSIVGYLKSAGQTGNDRVLILENQILKPNHDAKQTATIICRELEYSFKQYNRIREYYIYMTGNRFFTPYGEPKAYQDVDGMMQTYETWLYSHDSFSDLSTPASRRLRTLGVGKEVAGFSTGEDVHAAMPSKSKPNRRHRFGKSGSMN